MADNNNDNAWKPFKVSYGYRGERVTDEAYLTITVGDKKNPTRQIVVLPTCGRLLAKWDSDAPCNFAALRERALKNAKNLNSVSAGDTTVC